MLKRLHLIDDKNFVLLKGKVALEISMSELMITELIIENVFSQMQPCEIVSLLSGIVYQQKSNQTDENYLKTSFNNAALDQGRDRMVHIAQQLNNIQKECQLPVGGEDDYLEQLNFGLVPVVYEWSKGVSFVKITSMTEAQEGVYQNGKYILKNLFKIQIQLFQVLLWEQFSDWMSCAVI